MDFRLQSPYCNNYRIPNQQKGLIVQHLIVRKLTRRELEDKYLRIIDENYNLKLENNVQKEKIKVLTTKLLRLSKENSKYKSREFLFMDENNEIQEAEEFFRSRRPASSSAIPRKELDTTRNSTPNLLSKFKSEDYFFQNLEIDRGRGNNYNNKMESSNIDSSVEATKARMAEMENEIKKLNDDLKKYQQDGELDKETNAQLEVQVQELKEKLGNQKMQGRLEESVQIETLNRKIKELQHQLNEIEKSYQKKVADSKMEQEKLTEMLDKERQKLRKLDSQSQDLDAAQKMIQELMERTSTLEKEKADLSCQYEKYATISDEVVSYKQHMFEMTQALEAKEKLLEQERNDKMSIEHSQTELLGKMKELQKENDKLVIKLEGMKTENDSLINKNKKLENRIKVLEDQNKLQLQQINDALKIPVPLKNASSADFVKSRVQKDIQKIVEIRENVLDAVEITPSNLREVSRTDTLIHLSSSPPHLTVPSMLVHEKKRPSSSTEEQEKIIPKIVEPKSSSTTSNVSETSKPLKEGYTSTINSQDAPAIPQDSPQAVASTSRAFAETFSRSISNDAQPSISEDIDPKTFSIDQRTTMIDNSGILKHLGNGQRSSYDNSERAAERAKDLLIDEVMSMRNKKMSVQRRVRMSLDAHHIMLTPESDGSSRSSQFHSHETDWSGLAPKRDEESLACFLHRRTSVGSNSLLSQTRKPVSKLSSCLDSLYGSGIKLGSRYVTKIIEIEIISLQMVPDSTWLIDDTVENLYVEYTFLDYKGHLLETPQSMVKPERSCDPIFYRFRRKFELRSDKHESQLKILKSMLKNDTNVPLRFLIVNEPIDIYGTDENDGDCQEVGFATVYLNKLIEKSSNDSEQIDLNVYSTSFPHQLVAILAIEIYGFDFMRDMLK